MHFDNTISIQRTPREVFAYLADFSNIPAWNYAIVETKQTSSGPVGLGTTVTQVRSIPTRSEETLVVSQFVEGQLLALEGQLGPFTGVMSYRLEETADGTRLTNTADLQPHGVMRLASPLVGGRLREAVAENLQVLKAILESE